MSKNIVSRASKVVILLSAALVQLHLEYCGSIFGPQHNSDKGKPEQAQQLATVMVKHLEQLMYKETMSELHLLSVEKRRLQGALVTIFHF